MVNVFDKIKCITTAPIKNTLVLDTVERQGDIGDGYDRHSVLTHKFPPIEIPARHLPREPVDNLVAYTVHGSSSTMPSFVQFRERRPGNSVENMDIGPGFSIAFSSRNKQLSIASLPIGRPGIGASTDH